LLIVQDDEDLTEEQIKDEIKKIKEAYADDEGWCLFPLCGVISV